MSEIRKNLGGVTAYAYARSKGYTGTEEEFAQLMANYATVGETATEAAEQAISSAEASGVNSLKSEGYSVGKQNGEDVEEGSPYYHNNAKYYAEEAKDSETNAGNSESAASGSASDAEANALKSEGFAVGKQDGAAVTSESLYYHNNAKYYAEQSAASAATSAAMTGLAPAFSASKAYVTGDYVLYNGTLYRFTEAHAAGAWTGNDATAVTLGPDVADLKNAFNKSTMPIYKVDMVNTDNNIRQPFHVKTGDTVVIRTADGSNFAEAEQLRFYGADGAFIDYIATVPYTTSIRVFTYRYAEAFYIGITRVASVNKDYIVENYSNEYNLEQPLNNAQNDITQLQTKVENIENDLYEQTVILTDNSLHAFPISIGTTIVITTADGSTLPEGNPYLQCYDSNEAFLGQFLCSSAYGKSRTVTISSYSVAYVKMYAVPSKAIKVYIPDNTKIIPKVDEIANIVGQNKIIVDASGSGDYTSFTQAIYDTVDSGIDVFVKPGTYDIIAEYVALFGQEAVDSMADADSAIFNGFQYGVRLRNRKVEFAPGARLVCDWTGHTVDGTHRFSALGVDYDVKISGLHLVATATFYAIHDDYGISTPYTVEYENCYVEGIDLVNADCIGGGCKKYSKHILKNSYFDNHLTGAATVRYHNTNAEGAVPEIYVSNCYFNNWFTPRWYGAQTSKMRVYVNNCEARAIYKLAESSSYNVDNVELYKWCNTETNPVT